jgi:hypothetical protein
MHDPFRIAIAALVVLTSALGTTPFSFADEPAPQPSQPTDAGKAPDNPTDNAPPPATVLHKDKVQGVLGRDVRSNTDEDMGRIVDVIVDRSGGPRAAIIDFGGFLGVGSRKIAVDWNALHFAPDGSANPIMLDLTRDQVKAAPEYTDKKPIVALGASGSAQPIPTDETPLQQE